VLQTIYAVLHWPLLVAASLALLAVRPFPSQLALYATRAEALTLRFLEKRSRLEQSPRSLPLPPLAELQEIHASFKMLVWPDSVSAYHWAISEAMRHDIEALRSFAHPRAYDALRSEADRHWLRAEDEAQRLSA
jgi:hypothetical protein